MRPRILLCCLIVGVVGLASCANETPESAAERYLFDLADYESTQAKRDRDAAQDYRICFRDEVNKLDEAEGDDDPSLVARIYETRQDDFGTLRERLVKVGVDEAAADALLTKCELASGSGSSGPADSIVGGEGPDTIAPTPTTPQTTAATEAFPDLLLRLVEASTDGMVPPDKQECYRNALLAALPQGENTVVEAPASMTRDSLQQVLAGLGISVQQQGDLLGKCMMG